MQLRRKQAQCNHLGTLQISVPRRCSYRPCCYKEIPIARYGIHSSVSVAVLTDVMAWHPRPYSFSAPAMFGFVDPTKACFILKHQTNPFLIVENFLQFMDSSVNFLRLQPPLVQLFSDVCFGEAFLTIHAGVIQSISDHVPFRGRPSLRKQPLSLSHRLCGHHLLR